MLKRTQTGLMQNSIWKESSGVASFDPDDLKCLVREGLTAMKPEKREVFILELENDLQSAKLSIRAYLIPIGISARLPNELTPGEIGHLIRYLKINVPGATLAVDRFLERLGVFGEKNGRAADRLAA